MLNVYLFLSNEKEFNPFLLSKGLVTCEDWCYHHFDDQQSDHIYAVIETTSLRPHDCLRTRLTRITYNQTEFVKSLLLNDTQLQSIERKDS